MTTDLSPLVEGNSGQGASNLKHLYIRSPKTLRTLRLILFIVLFLNLFASASYMPPIELLKNLRFFTNLNELFVTIYYGLLLCTEGPTSRSPLESRWMGSFLLCECINQTTVVLGFWAFLFPHIPFHDKEWSGFAVIYVLVYKHIVPFVCIILEALTQGVPLAKKGGIAMSLVVSSLYQCFYIIYYLVSGTAIYPVAMFTPGTAGYAFGLALNLVLMLSVGVLLSKLKDKQLQTKGMAVDNERYDFAFWWKSDGSKQQANARDSDIQSNTI